MAAGGYAFQNFMTAKYVLGGNSNYHYGLNVNTTGVPNPAPLEHARLKRLVADLTLEAAPANERPRRDDEFCERRRFRGSPRRN